MVPAILGTAFFVIGLSSRQRCGDLARRDFLGHRRADRIGAIHLHLFAHRSAGTEPIRARSAGGPLTVVPAERQRGPGSILRVLSIAQGVWVPACAGTTRNDRSQQPPGRADADPHRQERQQGAVLRRRDARASCRHRHAGLDARDGALGGRRQNLRFGLRRRHLRAEQKSRPPHRGDRSEVEIARAPDRRRRQCRAAFGDDGRAGHAVVDRRACQRGAGDRPGKRRGRAHRACQRAALDRHQSRYG